MFRGRPSMGWAAPSVSLLMDAIAVFGSGQCAIGMMRRLLLLGRYPILSTKAEMLTVKRRTEMAKRMMPKNLRSR